MNGFSLYQTMIGSSVLQLLMTFSQNQ